MKLFVRIQPKSSKEAVEQLADGSYKIFVHSPPIDGKANAAVVEVLAKHFKVAKSSVKIISGEKSRSKIVEIGEFLSSSPLSNTELQISRNSSTTLRDIDL